MNVEIRGGGGVEAIAENKGVESKGRDFSNPALGRKN